MAVFLLKLHSIDQIANKQQFILKYTYFSKSKTYGTEPIPITTEMESIMKSTVVDMLVFARRSFYNDCNFFKRIASYFRPENSFRIACEWDVESEDLSTNRRPTNEEDGNEMLLFTKFKAEKPSPNKQ